MFELNVDLVRNIEGARKGDTEAAKEVLRYFVESVRERTRADGKPHVTPTGTSVSLDWVLAAYLADCVNKILEGVDPGKALGISSGEAGRPKLNDDAKNDRDIQYALAIMERKRQKPDDTMPVHFRKVAAQFGLRSASTVRAAWKRKGMRWAAEFIDRLRAKEKGQNNPAIK